MQFDNLTMKDYYVILQIPSDSSQDMIRQAFRRLAKLHHPDKGKQEGSEVNEKKFSEISEAYETLRDPAKRREYDERLRYHQIGADFSPRRRADEYYPEAEPFYETFFNDVSMGADILLTQEEVLRGGAIRVDIPIHVACPYCWGMGMTFLFVCHECRGTGTLKYGYRLQVEIPYDVYHGQRVHYRIPIPGDFDKIVEFRFLIEW